MITEIIRSESPDRVTTMLIEKYNRFETVHVSTNLHKKSVEDYIKELEERFKDSADDLILLVVKLILPEKCPDFMITDRSGTKLLHKLKDVKKYLENNTLNDVHLSNLPAHFWSLLGECINDVETAVVPQASWDEYRELNSNVWGFKIVNPKYFLGKKWDTEL